VGGYPRNLAYDSGTGQILVTNGFDNTISVISDSSNSVVATVSVGTSPGDVVYDSSMGEIFVANGDGTISVISDSYLSSVTPSPSPSPTASASPSPTTPAPPSPTALASPSQTVPEFSSAGLVLVVSAVIVATLCA